MFKIPFKNELYILDRSQILKTRDFHRGSYPKNLRPQFTCNLYILNCDLRSRMQFIIKLQIMICKRTAFQKVIAIFIFKEELSSLRLKYYQGTKGADFNTFTCIYKRKYFFDLFPEMIYYLIIRISWNMSCSMFWGELKRKKKNPTKLQFNINNLNDS